MLTKVEPLNPVDEDTSYKVIVDNRVICEAETEDQANRLAIIVERGIATYRASMATKMLRLAVNNDSSMSHQMMANSPEFIKCIQTDRQFMAYVKDNNKIQAIKRLRELTGWGLSDAKDFVYDNFFNEGL